MDLAHATNLDRTYLARIEAGHSTIQIERTLRLLQELGVRLEAEMSTGDSEATATTYATGRPWPRAAGSAARAAVKNSRSSNNETSLMYIFP